MPLAGVFGLTRETIQGSRNRWHLQRGHMEELVPSYQTGSTQSGGSRDSGWHGWVGSGCQGNGVWRLCLAWAGSWCSL